MKDFYYILGVSPSSSQIEIKSAYRKLSLKFHPDKNQGDKFFEERFKEINEAYEILGNPDKKKDYDLAFMKKAYNEPIIPQILHFSVSTTTIKRGDILEIFWETNFANSVKILPFGDVGSSGTKKFKINIENSFVCKLIASNGTNVIYKEIQIVLKKETPSLPLIHTFESNKGIIEESGFIELSWQVDNATSVEIIGLGSLPISGKSKFNVIFKNDLSHKIELIAINKFGKSTRTLTILRNNLKNNNSKKKTDTTFLKVFPVVIFASLLIVFIGFLITKTSKGANTPSYETSINENLTPIDTITIDTTTEFTSNENVANNREGNQDSTNLPLEEYGPIDICNYFLASLNDRSCKNAWEVTYNPSWEQKGKQWFCSNEEYGGIQTVKIYTINEITNSGEEATIFIKYYTEDIYNNEKIYSQYFTVKKYIQRWYIVDIINVNEE